MNDELLNLPDVQHEAAQPHHGSAAHASRLSSTTPHDHTRERARFDHEFGASFEDVPPIGVVS